MKARQTMSIEGKPMALANSGVQASKFTTMP